ncbi:MAG: helix-turn-helix transcriptional regulator [Bacteroidetes bacterium]|nr:helix-turn-helix transcriptional regulator [Bacteroidota bacterium]
METGRYPNRLKTFRRIAGLSQKRVSKILGLRDTSMLSRWEHGFNVPALANLFILCQLYQATPQKLYPEVWKQAETNLLARTESF